MNASEFREFDDLIAEFLRQINQRRDFVFLNAFSVIGECLAEIDRRISAQLDEILHHQDFQKLEASWRGLQYLVAQTPKDALLRLFVFQATKSEIFKDFERSVEFYQSQTFAKIWFGATGGAEPAPFGVLIGDYEFGNHPRDLALLEHLSQTAAECHAPFVAASSPAMFGLDNFREFYETGNVREIFERAEYYKWQSFRESEAARYVGLCLPRVCLRSPYGGRTAPTETFNYGETIAASEDYLWGNAAYAFGTRLMEAFHLHRWCADVCGAAGGRVSDLPSVDLQPVDDGTPLKSAVEILIFKNIFRQLDEMGFIPLIGLHDNYSTAFFSAASCAKTEVYETEKITHYGRLYRSLPYIFAVSRFAHFIRQITLEKGSTFASGEELRSFLCDWLARFTLGDNVPDFWKVETDAATNAQYPLTQACISDVIEAGDGLGRRVIARIQSHFQLEELPNSHRIVVRQFHLTDLFWVWQK